MAYFVYHKHCRTLCVCVGGGGGGELWGLLRICISIIYPPVISLPLSWR